MNDEHQLKQLLREAQYYQIEGLIKLIEETLSIIIENYEKKKKVYNEIYYLYKKKKKQGQYAIVYLGGYGKSAQIYTKDTGGGFSESCITLNKLAAEGYHIEGVASGANGNKR